MKITLGPGRAGATVGAQVTDDVPLRMIRQPPADRTRRPGQSLHHLPRRRAIQPPATTAGARVSQAGSRRGIPGIRIAIFIIILIRILFPEAGLRLRLRLRSLNCRSFFALFAFLVVNNSRFFPPTVPQVPLYSLGHPGAVCSGAVRRFQETRRKRLANGTKTVNLAVLPGLWLPLARRLCSWRRVS